MWVCQKPNNSSINKLLAIIAATEMSMELVLGALLLPLVLAALLQPAAVVAVGDGAQGGGFSLQLVPSPGWNRTFHVDGNGFLHLNEEATTALGPPMHQQIGPNMYSVVTSVAHLDARPRKAGPVAHLDARPAKAGSRASLLVLPPRSRLPGPP